MFIPYRDDNPTERFAGVTFLIIVANVLVFLYQGFGPLSFEVFIRQYGLIPAELTAGKNLPGSGLVSPYANMLTSLFVHGGLTHLAFNMLFLWIFGNNVEDRMTRGRFLLFYLLTGALSALAFVFSNPSFEFPLIGASGSVSAVLGAYLCMFPFARVRVLVLVFAVRMPAMMFLGIWFLLQISGLMGDTDGPGERIAWVSHIAGFAAGIALFRLFTRKRETMNTR